MHCTDTFLMGASTWIWMLLVLSSVDYSYAQGQNGTRHYWSLIKTGQDYYFANTGQQQPHFLTYQQPQRTQQTQQQQTQQQFSNFFSPVESSVFTPFRSSSSSQNSQFQPVQNNFGVQPSHFQIPPSASADDGQFIDAFRQPAPTQFRTNQHLPQPFHHLQAQQSGAQRFPFEIQTPLNPQRFQETSPRFQAPEPVTLPKPTFNQNSFIGIKNTEDENGRTTQSYVNVHHPQGIVEHSPTPQTTSNRWKQADNIRRQKKPVSPLRQNDFSNTFVDQQLLLDESTSVAPASPTTDFTSLRTGAAVDKRKNEVQNYSRPRNQPTKENTRQFSYIESRARKPSTLAAALSPEDENIKPTTVRANRLQIARVKPTTYSPLLHSGTIPNRQFNRNQLKGRFNNASRDGIKNIEANNNLEHNSASTVASSEFDEKQVIKEYQRHSFNKKVANPNPQLSNRGVIDGSNLNKRVNLPSSIPSVEEEHFEEEAGHGNEETIENATDFVPYDEEEISDDHEDEHEHTNVSTHQESHGVHDANDKYSPSENDHKVNATSTFEVLPMHQDQPQVSDDNFKKFVDSVSIDSTDKPPNLAGEPDEKAGEVSGVTVTMESDVTSLNHTKSLNEDDELSSVVTTMSITNESDKSAPQSHLTNDQINAPPSTKSDTDDDTPQPTESWVIVASVQTSRSVSGARFLPSGSVNQEEFPSPLAPKPTSNIGNKTLSETSSISESVESSSHEISKTGESHDEKENLKEAEIEETPSITVPSSTAAEAVSTKSPVSTESIIDKLDRVQSELSSGILTGGFRPGANKLDLDVLPEMTSENNSSSVTSSSTSTSTTSTTTTTTPGPNDPPPVVIRKFSPSSRRGSSTSTTTSKPNKKIAALIENIQFDELGSGLLPPGFKPRSGFTRKSTTTSTTTPKTASDTMQADEAAGAKSNSTREGSGRSSGLGGLENKIKFDDVSAFLPPGFKPSASSTEKPKGLESLLSKIKFDDASSLLPPGYKPRKSDKNETKEEKKIESKEEKKVPEIKFEVPSNLLPPGYKAPAKSSTEKKVEPVSIDFSALLPPGYKLTTESAVTTESNVLDAILSKVKLKDVSSLLPAGFNESTTTAIPSTSVPDTTTSAGPKVVFPSRPGGSRKNSNSSPSRTKSAGGIGPVAPKIQKGWPTRATTEFTGWPTSSTTPIPIEKIIAQAKAAAAAAAAAASTSTEEATTTSTTTTSTTTTPRSTTPGICTEDCNLAATIKLVAGTKWVPELLDHNTKEWQLLANEVEEQLENVYSSSESLSKWYKKITIDAFSQGSVLVDYFVELSELGRTVNTADMKRMFHDSLHKATVNTEALQGEASTADAAAMSSQQYKLGKFVVDPKFTDFVVLPKAVVPTVGMAEEDVLLPQWAIAVIVIGLASLLFVIIFGVTVLVNRHKSAKKKSPVALTEDMLNELNKNHMGGLDNYGADDLYNMEDVWNDKPPKKRSSGSLHDNSMANLYDSWRSEWNGYYYNAYYGNGSSTSGGYGRRRSDYDTNF